MTNNTNQESLANQIAHDLGEPEDTALYVALYKRYGEEHIRRAHAQALKVPAASIRKSRGALFLYLLRKYARQDQDRKRGTAGDADNSSPAP